MKTRIISGIIIGAVVTAVITCGKLISPIFITAFISLCAAVAIYELLFNVVGIKSKPAIIGSVIFGLAAPAVNSIISENFVFYILLCITYFMYSAVVILINHKKFSISQIFAFCAMPMIVSFAFSCLETVINYRDGLYYLLLLIGFSSICDTGAYFVGVTLGKHKLCPEISPKKTVEGAVGGIVTALIYVLIVSLSFGKAENLIVTLIVTVPFCIIGMLGDLFASVIKRSVGIKDYGTLIPGHGGMLDRFDSILFIAPIMVALKILRVL